MNNTALTAERSRSCPTLPDRGKSVSSAPGGADTSPEPTVRITDLLEIDLVLRLLGLGALIYAIGYFELGMTLVCILLAGVYTWERNNRQHEATRIQSEFSYKLHRQQPAPEGTTQRAQWLEELVRASWPIHRPNYDSWFEEQMKVWVSWIPPGQVRRRGAARLSTTAPGGIHTSGECAAR